MLLSLLLQILSAVYVCDDPVFSAVVYLSVLNVFFVALLAPRMTFLLLLTSLL